MIAVTLARSGDRSPSYVARPQLGQRSQLGLCGGQSLFDQIAQKLHGATEDGSERAHDLIDLQIVVARGLPDMKRLNMVCRRLFAYRKRQHWPARVVKNEDWENIYNEERGSLSVLPSVDEAIVWANDLIKRIATAN